MTAAQLASFVAICRARNFGQAAEALGKSQPAVTLDIQNLEAEVGLTLFERGGRSLALTGAGEILRPLAEGVVQQINAARARLDEVRRGTRGRLRIGVLPTVAAYFLPRVLQRFRLQYADVEIALTEDSENIYFAPQLLNREIDLSLAIKGPKMKGFRAVELLTEDYCLTVSEAHPLANRKHVALTDLAREDFIIYRAQAYDSRQQLEHVCRVAGFEPRIRIESAHLQIIAALAAANLGIAFLPEMLVRSCLLRGLVCVELRGPISRRAIVVAWRSGQYLSGPARGFIRCATEAGEEWRAYTGCRDFRPPPRGASPAAVGQTSAFETGDSQPQGHSND
ncbi:MAG: LysR family transcriptional regulator [Acidobacteria bacterium]|nr:LysR family transcriptional regulator [Acidobacteriota bacterium]